MAWGHVFGGTARYEFRMQIRRRAVWVVIAVLSVLLILLVNIPSGGLNRPEVQTQIAVNWAQVLGLFLPIGAGILVADRLPRDRRTRVEEVLATAPAAPGARLAGKYAGSTLGTVLPAVVYYAGGTAYLLTQVPDVRIVGTAVAAFAAIVLPALLFVGALSIAGSAVLAVPLYQCLLCGYWLWGNLMSPKLSLPSPTFTLLNAAGPWASEGLFHVRWFFFPPHVSAAQAVANLTLLLGLSAGALLGTGGYLRWQRARA
jgi:hypothetical protein